MACRESAVNTYLELASKSYGAVGVHVFWREHKGRGFNFFSWLLSEFSLLLPVSPVLPTLVLRHNYEKCNL